MGAQPCGCAVADANSEVINESANGCSDEVLNAETLEFLAQVKLFQQLPKEDLPALASCAEPVKFKPGEVIIQQGEQGNALYILRSGEVSVMVDGAEVITLGAREYFGEKALLQDEPRTATIEATSEVNVLKITRDAFDKHNMREKLDFERRQAVIGAGVPKDELRASTPKTEAEQNLIRSALLKNTKLQTMVTLDDKRLKQFIELAWKERVPKGKELITEGDINADYFYVVQSGRFDVTRRKAEQNCALEMMGADGTATEVGEVFAGGSFGELALLHLAPRAATVTAHEDAEVWVIGRGDFKTVMAKTQEETMAEYQEYLSQVVELSALLDDEKELVAHSLTEVYFQKNDLIFNQGEEGKELYILVDGEVSMIRNSKEASRMKATKERCHVFGEKALLNDAPRAATVKVTSDTAKALSLAKDNFDMLLGPLKEIQQRGRRGKSKAGGSSTRGPITIGDRTFGNIFRKDLQEVGLLGTGGFGTVTLVEHVPTANTYALKALSKGYIVKSRMQQSCIMEKTVQLICNSDFIIKLYETYNSDQHLYLLLELALGGELYATFMKNALHGKDKYAKFYVGGIVLAFEHLHSRKVIFRDLKPENMLLTEKGDVKLTDMGLAKVVIGRTFTTCGTPDYFAPEMVRSTGHSHGVDWWTLGVLTYELMVGRTPFSAPTPMVTYQKVTRGITTAHFPPSTRGSCEELIKSLCRVEPSDRLPMKRGGVNNIKKHKWYQGFDWQSLAARTMTPPYIPKVKHKKDLTNFSKTHSSRPPKVEFKKEDDTGWDASFATST